MSNLLSNDKELSYTADKAITEFQFATNKFLEKLSDYGTHDINDVNQVISRIKEKLARLERVLSKDEISVKDEMATDTFIDIAGYSIIANLLLKGDWGKVINDEMNDKSKEYEDILLIQRSKAAKEFELPTPKKNGDVGFDLYTVEDILINANNEHNPHPFDVPTGIKVKLPKGYWALVINRSSTPRKLGIEVVPGIIDNGYTGELFACCFNRTGKDIMIHKGTRLAQFILLPAFIPKVVEVDQLPETERGESGFGSTGK